jgi:hypothetical protein
MKATKTTSGPSVSWEMIQAAAAGVQEAWDAIVDRYAGLVWTVACDQQLSERGAADVSRLTWMRFHDRLGVISPDDVASWLEQTAERESIRLARLPYPGSEAEVLPA